RVCLGLSQELPFVAGEKAGAATSTEPGCFDLLDYTFGASIDQYLVQCLITTDGDILLDVFGIDQSAIAQNNLLLSLEKGDCVPVRDIWVALAVFHVPCNVIPFLDLAVDEIGRH